MKTDCTANLALPEYAPPQDCPMARCIDGEGILFVAEKPPLWSGDCLEPIQGAHNAVCQREKVGAVTVSRHKSKKPGLPGF